MATTGFGWERLVGSEIDGYRIEDRIGGGSYGVVFRAVTVLNDKAYKAVALKLIPVSPENMKSAERELQAADTLEHEQILGCLKLGQCSLLEQSFFYVAMPLASSSLRTRIQRGRLSADELRALASVAGALQYMHEREPKLVHRDLKPENILLMGEIWKIADFGSTRHLNSHSTQVLSGQLTLQYAPPEELLSGEVSTATDMWAFGALLVEAATGRHPFANEDGFQISFVISGREPSISGDLPQPIRRIALGCLSRDPKTRLTAALVQSEVENWEECEVGDPVQTSRHDVGDAAADRQATEEERPPAQERSTAEEPVRPQGQASVAGQGPESESMPPTSHSAPQEPDATPTPTQSKTSGRNPLNALWRRLDRTLTAVLMVRLWWRPMLLWGVAIVLLLCLAAFGIYKFSPSDVGPSLSIAVSPHNISQGQTATLVWSVGSAQQVKLDGKEVQNQGSMIVRPTSTTTYTLSVRGQKDREWSKADTVFVESAAQSRVPHTVPPSDPSPSSVTSPNVPSPSIEVLEVVPNLVSQCQSVAIRWTVRNTTSVDLEPEIGQFKPSDFAFVKPIQTTRVTLTATGPGGTVSRDVTVSVIPGPLSDCPH